MNKVYLIGRVTKDLELQHYGTNERSYVKFTLAVDEYNTTTKEKSANIQSLSAKSAHEFIIILRTKVGHIMKTFWRVFIMHTAV